jgi:hypothetical protein
MLLCQLICSFLALLLVGSWESVRGTGAYLPVDNLVAWSIDVLSDRKQEGGSVIGYIRRRAVDGLMTVVYTILFIYILKMSDIYSHSVCPG